MGYGPGNRLSLLDEILAGQQKPPSGLLGNPLDDAAPQGLLGSNPFGSATPQGLLGPDPTVGGLLNDPNVGYGQILQQTPAFRQRPAAEREIGHVTDLAEQNRAKVGGITDRLLGGGGVDQMAADAGGQTLSDARRAGLLNFGITLMGAGQKGPGRRRMGETIANALQAGQQGYAGTVETAGKVEALGKAKEMEAKKKAIYDKYAGKITDPESLGQMMGELAAIGDTAGLGPLSNVYNAMAAADAARGKKGKLHWLTDQYGGQIIGVDENTGEPKVMIPIGTKPGPGDGLTAAQRQAERRTTLAARHNMKAGFMRDTKNDRTLISQVQPVLKPLKAALKTGQVNGPLQVAAIFKFINGLDQTAAREGEVAFAARAAGWRDQLRQAVQQAKGGPAILPPQLLQDLTDQMEGRYRQAISDVRYAQNAYTEQYTDEIGEAPSSMFFGVNINRQLSGEDEEEDGGEDGATGGAMGGLMEGVEGPGQTGTPATPEQVLDVVTPKFQTAPSVQPGQQLWQLPGAVSDSPLRRRR